jgi:hypothetical protein
MKPELRSLTALRAVNPVKVDAGSAHSARARAVFEQIVAEPRRPSGGRGTAQRSRIVASGFAAVLACALVVAAIVISGPGASPAFAGWTAVPSATSPEQIARALRRCNSRVPLVMAEERGPYTGAVFGGPHGGVACVLGPSMSFAGGIGAAPVAADQIGTAVVSSTDARGNAFMLLAGRVGSAVTGVAIHRSDAREVIATVTHGWYLAWWPANTRATYATVTTSRGGHTTSLPPLATGNPGSACRAPVGGGCAGVDGSGGAGLMYGPPMFEDVIARPFGSVLLFVVDSARRVRFCLHQAAPHPGTSCTYARLLTALPRSYPVQRNLLQVFYRSVWAVRLPHPAARHGSVTAVISMIGFGRWGNSTQPVSFTW